MRRALRSRGLAGTALVAASAVLTGLVYATPARADDPPAEDPDAGQFRISLGQDARMNRCVAGTALHIGGPTLKAAAAKALNGTDADLTAALEGAQTGLGTLGDARGKDNDGVTQYLDQSRKRTERWETANKIYAQTGWDSGTEYHAPEFDKDVVAFTLGPQRDLYGRLGQDGRSVPTKASVDQARKIAADIKGQDDWNDFATDSMFRDTDVRGPYNWTTASDVASFLRHGGFVTKPLDEGSAEYRMEVESLKVAWGGCDSFNPVDARRNLTPVVLSAHQEWEQEYAAQAKPRSTIMAAEASASAEARKTTEAMIESIGQAWLAEQILLWQKYWAGQPKDNIHRPKAAVFTQAKTDLANAQKKAAEQLTLANKAVAVAKTASEQAGTAQNDAYAIADAAKTPRGRGLLYAQQSVQAAKASYAAAQAAAKATQTAVNAAKATVADSKALFALSQTQAHAINTEFRRIAAQEAAAQAKAARVSADALAKEAAANATKAKNAQATAEAAEKTAKQGAATAAAERAKAEKERDNAKRERANAAAERSKAKDAEQRAQSDRDAASRARTAAETAGGTAAAKREEAEEAEAQAYLARDLAVAAEKKRDAAKSRAAAMEAAAEAAKGSAAAGEAREAATEARSAATEATDEARDARAAANDASEAAVKARAAATRADAAASRSRAAADNAWSAYETTRAAAATAHAAAAEAIDAAAAAKKNAADAEAEGKKAAAAAVTARKEATAAKAEAAKTAAWAATTAGYAFAAGEAATAARDSAAEVIKPANQAIAMGTPYKETDVSAAFAVLVGQTSKPIAERQAAAAKAKADEAAKAAKAAKALAEKAKGDAKLAAEAAAAAADDAAKAAASVAAARASAAEAATAAEAAKKADANAQKYDQQAGTDAVYAGMAANEAESEAAAADREADEAEKDAASARSAATAAEKDAASSRNTATKAEQDATAAETAAKNADGAAKDADQAADRAEQEERKRLEQQRREAMEAGETGVPGGSAGPALSADDEAVLRAQCGQQCVDDYRAAQAAVSLSVIDWVKANGGEILLEVLGVNNVKRCFGEDDIESCLWSFVDVASLALVVGKLPAVGKAIVRVASGIAEFFEKAAWGRKTLTRLKDIIEKFRKGQLGECVLDAADLFSGAAGASKAKGLAAAKAAGGKKRFCGIDHISPIDGDWCTKRGAHVNLKNGREVGLQTTNVKGGIMGYAIDVKAGAATNDEIRAVVQTLIDDDRLREDLIAKSTDAMRIFNQDAANQRYNEKLETGQKPRPLRWGCKTNFAPKLKFLIDALKEISRQKGVG
ncbi:predicted protein [Streptomyces viridochromogenes DSM 40736]|uniref:Predicted protein n=1 Tax=Streptomyces viridochromogenes (strain DSM 40736 / JCM 4977 / BCRC 1201 / Tue 494) TaxID=591159 RepID=D9XHC7_STRVT|nr:predicted protein [Streptomyces viridochromogenes DSM 40736]